MIGEFGVNISEHPRALICFDKYFAPKNQELLLLLLRVEIFAPLHSL